MSTCLLHWKPDVPWKSPVLTTKMVALFLEGLTGQPDSLHKWKKKSVSSDERFLVGSQCASKPRDVAVPETRNSGVFLPWILKSLCSSLFVIIQGFFPWNIWGLFNLNGKATIWGLISPKESSVAVDGLENLGEVFALPITKCIKRQCPPSTSAVFLKSVAVLICLVFFKFHFLRLFIRYWKQERMELSFPFSGSALERRQFIGTPLNRVLTSFLHLSCSPKRSFWEDGIKYILEQSVKWRQER